MLMQAFPPFSGVRAEEEFTDHAWTGDDRIAATTRRGALLVIDDCEVRQEFAPRAPGVAVAAPAPAGAAGESAAWTVRAAGRLLIVGGSGGRFDVYTRDEPLPAGGGGAVSTAAAASGPGRARAGATGGASVRPPYFLTRALVVSMDGAPVTRVIGLAWSPSQEQLAVAADAGIGIVNVPLLGLMDASETAVSVVWVARGGHTAPVTSVDVCRTKPLLATCAPGDGSVRVWNYATKRLDACWMEPDAVARAAGASSRCVSFHPAGHVVAATAPGRIRILSVLAGELSVAHDIVAHVSCAAACRWCCAVCDTKTWRTGRDDG